MGGARSLKLRVRVRHGKLPERELVQRRSGSEGNFHIAAAPGTDALYVRIVTARVTAAVKLEHSMYCANYICAQATFLCLQNKLLPRISIVNTLQSVARISVNLFYY